MPVSNRTKVITSYVRWPLRLYGHTVYRLITDDGDFVSARHPDIYDRSGAPTALSSELAPGSVVRVSTNDVGLMVAVQLVHPIYRNPFALMQFLLRVIGPLSGNPCAAGGFLIPYSHCNIVSGYPVADPILGETWEVNGVHRETRHTATVGCSKRPKTLAKPAFTMGSVEASVSHQSHKNPVYEE